MNNRSNWVTLFFYLFNVKYKFVFCKFQFVEWKNILLSNKKHKIHKKILKKNTSLNDGFSHFKFLYLHKHLSNKGMTLFMTHQANQTKFSTVVYNSFPFNRFLFLFTYFYNF